MTADPGDPPAAQLPSRPPTPADIENNAAFDKLADTSLSDTRAAAQKWRDGLAALITLVTGGLLLKGPGAASDLPTHWRLALTILAAIGIGAAILGLWYALKAIAGVPRRQDIPKLTEKYRSVRVYTLAQADKASHALQLARHAVLVALPVLGATVIVWWWAPTVGPTPPAYIEIDSPGTSPVCGELQSADNGRIRLKVVGEEKPRIIQLREISNLRVKASC